MKISTGERTLIRQNTDRLESWVFDLKGELRLAVRSAENGDTEILRVDPDKFTKVYSCTVFETCGPVRYHKDGKRVYMIDSKGDSVDLGRLTLFDPQTGKMEIVESDPEKRVVAQAYGYDGLGEVCLVAILVQAHARPGVVEVDKAAFGLSGPGRNRVPDGKNAIGDRGPRHARGLERGIAVAAPVRSWSTA